MQHLKSRDRCCSGREDLLYWAACAVAARQGVADAVAADAIGADGPLGAGHGALNSGTNACQHFRARTREEE